MRFTKEEIKRANEVDLVDLLDRAGYRLKKHTEKEYYLVDHDSLKVSRHKGWYWNSRGIGGKPIDFFMSDAGGNMTFLEAVSAILGDSVIKTHSPKDAVSQIETRTEEFIEPLRNKSNDRIIEYLTKARCINENLISSLIGKGSIYEEKKFHNVVFPGYNTHGEMKSAFKRGTHEKRFAGVHENSDKRYAFKLESGNNKLHVFESPIDAMSYISMTCDLEDNFLGMFGVSDIALEHYLSVNKNIDTIYLRVDNDFAGKRYVEKAITLYGDKYKLHVALPESKDYNDDLIKLKSKGLK